MDTKTIVICVVALLLGMLLFNMLKDVCGCKNIVEGQGVHVVWRQTAPASATTRERECVKDQLKDVNKARLPMGCGEFYTQTSKEHTQKFDPSSEAGQDCDECVRITQCGPAPWGHPHDSTLEYFCGGHFAPWEAGQKEKFIASTCLVQNDEIDEEQSRAMEMPMTPERGYLFSAPDHIRHGWVDPSNTKLLDKIDIYNENLKNPTIQNRCAGNLPILAHTTHDSLAMAVAAADLGEGQLPPTTLSTRPAADLGEGQLPHATVYTHP